MAEIRWDAINEYVLAIETARSIPELYHEALERMHNLIPSDGPAGICDVRRFNLYNIGAGEAFRSAYNERYRFLCPPYANDPRCSYPNGRFFDVRFLDFTGLGDCEFTVDFAFPHHVHKSLVSPQYGGNLVLGLTRSRHSAPFTAEDAFVLGLATRHFNNIATILDNSELMRSATLKRFPELTCREAEIAVLLCGGYSAEGIARRLFISPRTVETHIAHIYWKLGVQKRDQAVNLLRGDAAKADENRSAERRRCFS